MVETQEALDNSGRFVTRFSLKGFPYQVWEPEVPRIPDAYLWCVVYLYPSVPDAEAGTAAGGSGFLVSVPLDGAPDRASVYAVTNSHVISGGSTVIRVNLRDGTFDAIDYHEKHWVHHPDGDDLAIAPVGLDDDRHQITFIPRQTFLSDSITAEHNIGVGDDTIILGRFISHEGKQKNTPSARFGCIAQMPDEPIPDRRPTGVFEQESFLVEARSIPGYSGSPVLVYVPPFSPRHDGSDTLRSAQYGPWLLGIDWCHLNDWVPAKDNSGNCLPFKVRANSGMMGVIPAWKLERLLDMDEFKELRAAQSAAVLQRRKRPPAATPDSAEESDTTTKADNPSHKEDFSSLLTSVARGKPSAEKT